MSRRVFGWVDGVRWLVLICSLALIAAVLQPGQARQAAEAAEIPQALPGAGPVDRPAPLSLRPDTAVTPSKRPPVVPSRVSADGRPSQLSARRWLSLPKPGARLSAAAADDAVFTRVLLRPGYVLGDTSLLAYFDVDEARPWRAWRVRVFDAASRTEQASTSLTRQDLERSRCLAQREYCRSFGAADGWKLDPAKRYFIVVTALFSDRSVESPPSQRAEARHTIVPPAIATGQAAGCSCGNALGMTAARQAVRGEGVNTATGAYSRVETDVVMASFGTPFVSNRTYSSANPAGGLFGPGWAWSYGMQVIGSRNGAVVQADDGAQARFRRTGGRYVAPAGVRSTLRETGTGWVLTTPEQVSYGFDGSGRLASVLNARRVGVRLTYTEKGVEVTDASGRVASVRIESGLIRRISLPDHRNVEFSYDEDSRLVAAEDARGNVWRYRYSVAGPLTEVLEPKANRHADPVVAVRNTYSGSGRVARQFDAQGHRTSFAWNAGKQEAKTTDADGVVVWDGYHDNVLIYSQRGNGDSDVHRYDRRLNRSLVVNGDQNQNEAAFDARGNTTMGAAPQPLRFDQRTKYDDRNNPIEFVDERGNKWKSTYNRFNELVESIDAEKHRIRYAYDSRGLLISRTDQRGKVSHNEYLPAGDANAGLLSATVSAEGRRTEFGYDETGRRVAVVDPRGTVDGADRDDFTTRFRFDEQDHTVEVREPGKRHWARTVYDPVGRVVETVTPAGVKTKFGYFANSLLRSVADPRRTTTYGYSDAGRRTESRVHLDDAPDIVTTYGYNAKGLLRSITSPRGNVPGANPKDFTTTYRYDGNDNLARISRPYPGGKVVTQDVKVDALDRTTATVDEFNRPSTFKRDPTGNVTAATDTLGHTTQMSYDKNGQQTRLTDASKKTTRFSYDAAGNKTKSVTATGGTTTWTYDDDGLLISKTEPRGNVTGADKERFTTHYEYDQAGNRTKVIDPLDHATTYAYDADNRQVAVTDAKGRTTRYSYREDDKISTARAPDAPSSGLVPTVGATVYDYYDDGRLASVRDPKHHTTRLGYDDAGRLTSTVDPLGRRAEIGYDAEDNPVSMITTRGHERLTDDERARRTMVNTFDIVGRRTKRQVGTDGPVYTWGYDAKDRTTSYGDPTGVRNVSYDDEDQITQVVRRNAGGATERFSYGYDARGNITSRNYPDGTRITAGYDADSRVTSLTSLGGAAGGTAATWRFGYDVAGERTSTTLPTATGLVEKRTYDDAGRLTDIGTTRASDAAPTPQVQDPVSAFKLDLDEVGNPTREVTTRGGDSESVAYDYDSADRVTSACYAATSCDERSAGRIDYTYDLVGNRTSQKRTGSAGHDLTRYFYDSADQLQKKLTVSGPDISARLDIGALLRLDDAGASLDVGALLGIDADLGVDVTGYDYDVDGNQTRAGKDTFTYNLDNSMATAEIDGRTASFDYDATGLRLSASTGSGQDKTTQRWSWDVNGTLPQLAADTTTGSGGQVLEKRGFTYGPDDEPLALLDPATGAHSYTHDWLGGVANMLSPNGQPEAGYDYDPFGNPRDGSTLGGGQANRTGKRAGSDSGSPGGGPGDVVGGVLGGVLGGSDDSTPDDSGSGGGLLGGLLGGARGGLLGSALVVPARGAQDQAGGSAVDSKAAAKAPKNPLRFAGAYQDSASGDDSYYLRARNYHTGTGRFTSTDPMPTGSTAASDYTYADNNPLVFTDATGAMLAPDPGGVGPTPPASDPPSTATPDRNDGPNPEELAKAQQIQSKSVLDVVLEAGGQILMEVLGINDLLDCLKGDLVACVSTVVGVLPWGKIFKAKKIAEAIYRAGKAVVTFFEEVKWARAVVKGAKRAAEAAKAAKARAVKAAAERAAAARATAERAARAAAEKAAARAKAVASRAKAATKRHADDACHSFAAGTRVLLADGSSKPIDRLEPGDTVVAGNPTAGSSEPRQVTHTIRTDNDRHFVDVTVRTNDGTHTITTTDNHPFWSTTSKRWVDAGDLERGDRLRTADRSYATVGAIQEYDGGRRTYDLTVDATHTYYVLAGSTPVLVHNCGVSPEPGRAPAGSTLEDYRNANVGTNAPRFVTEYTSINGNRYYGRTTPGAVDIEPGSHLDDVATRHHGGCSEVCALNEAQKAGDDILGGTFRTLKTNSGESVDPCPACQTMIRNLFGTFE